MPNAPLMLVSVAGPKPVSFLLEPPHEQTIGRRSSNTLILDHPEVSKDHAAIRYGEHQTRQGWNLVDLGSRHGTRLNGVSLSPHRECPISPGDLIEIAPWTFCVMDQAGTATTGARVKTVDDTITSGSTVTSLRAEAGHQLAQERLRLLLHCSEALQRARDETSLAEIVLNAAVSGTGFANAAVTRPMTPDGAIELIVGHGDIAAAGAAPRMSRSLIKAASHGVPVQLTDSGHTMRHAVSVAEFGIQDAICVPLMVESTVAGFLYLDNRSRVDSGTVAGDEASAFAMGIARLASMAWSNLMRVELERRYARMEGELSAAARAQQMILPKRHGCCGSISYIGECKPGRVVSGDFFDVLALPDGRVAVTIGDVAGKGIAASVVMTTAQGFMHGVLRQHGDLARAVRELSTYVTERCDTHVFVTMWAGIIDTAARTLTYIDAGHGYAWLVHSNGTVKVLDDEGVPPIGALLHGTPHTATVSLEPGGRLLLVSDGIIEQPAPEQVGARRDEFGRNRVEAIVKSRSLDQDVVAALFEAVAAHGGSGELADDATILVASW